MPKARINKNYGLMFWQNNIRLSKILARIFAIPQTGFPQSFAKQYLHFAVLAFDMRHYFASLLF